jgi:hypothetical protein
MGRLDGNADLGPMDMEDPDRDGGGGDTIDDELEDIMEMHDFLYCKELPATRARRRRLSRRGVSIQQEEVWLLNSWLC